MKSFFRFLRGEINGMYLNAISSAVDALGARWRSVMVQADELTLIRTDADANNELYPSFVQGVGLIAGCILPRFQHSSSSSALVMTESYIVNGKQRSERGLFGTTLERFGFVHTEQDDYADDINTLSNETHRSSLIGSEVPQGYISDRSNDVLRDDGTVDPAYVEPSPPGDNSPYTEFYGNNFLFLNATQLNYSLLSTELTGLLIEALQWVRWNGPSFAAVCRVVDIVCGDFVQVVDVRTIAGLDRWEIRYRALDLPDLRTPLQRLYLLQHIMEAAFINVVFTDIDA